MSEEWDRKAAGWASSARAPGLASNERCRHLKEYIDAAGLVAVLDGRAEVVFAAAITAHAAEAVEQREAETQGMVDALMREREEIAADRDTAHAALAEMTEARDLYKADADRALAALSDAREATRREGESLSFARTEIEQGLAALAAAERERDEARASARTHHTELVDAMRALSADRDRLRGALSATGIAPYDECCSRCARDPAPPDPRSIKQRVADIEDWIQQHDDEEEEAPPDPLAAPEGWLEESIKAEHEARKSLAALTERVAGLESSRRSYPAQAAIEDRDEMQARFAALESDRDAHAECLRIVAEMIGMAGGMTNNDAARQILARLAAKGGGK